MAGVLWDMKGTLNKPGRLFIKSGLGTHTSGFLQNERRFWICSKEGRETEALQPGSKWKNMEDEDGDQSR